MGDAQYHGKFWLIDFIWNLTKPNNILMKNTTKNHSDDLLNFCAIYEARNADIARTLGLWFDDKLREVYETNDFTHCQKVTVVFVTNTFCSPFAWKIVWELKQELKTSISDTNATSQTLCHLLLRASSMTVCCSPCYTSIIHCFSSLTSRILLWAVLHCLSDFTVSRFRPELLRWPHISHDKFWCLTCNMPLKSSAVPIFKFHKVVHKHI